MEIRKTLIRSAFALCLGIGGALIAVAPAQAGVLGGIDVQRACRANHGGDVWWNATLVTQDAFGWRCYSDKVMKYDNGIDMNAACRAQYGNRAKAHAFNVHDPYSWVCES
ncbi:hypothetical protein ACFYO1_31510 [Nocardia sp. NPDC006044]|uniref:hypothetical protein n=1 Tax=Nocardia sp. NPDC006044 TaxID=3364306 RepID=UPI0036C06F16